MCAPSHGLSTSAANRYEKIADIPEDKFEGMLGEWRENTWRIPSGPTTLVVRDYLLEAYTMDTDERLVLYQIATQDIRDLKANQWRYSHYGLLIQAALVAANTVLKTQELILCGLSVLTCLGIGFLIHEAQTQIAQLRPATDSLAIRRDETMAEWTKEFGPKRLKWLCWPRGHWKFWKRDRFFGFLFAGVQIVAMVLAIWVMLLGS